MAVALSACGSDDLPTAEEARDAGLKYGKAIVNTVGERATRGEMEALCGKAARDEALPGEDGHQADETIDAFIDGCVDAVAAEQ